MAIENDFTSPQYNSYFADITELDFFVSQLDGFWNLTSWNSLTGLQKENIMHGATTDLNKFCFHGSISRSIISPYEMKFPRYGMQYNNGVSILENEIPLFVKKYIAERSVEKNANIKSGQFYDGRIKRNKLGKLEQEFHNPKDSKDLVNRITEAASFANISNYVCGLASSSRYSFVVRY